MGGEDAKDDAKRSKDTKDEAVQLAAVVAAPDAKVTLLHHHLLFAERGMFCALGKGSPRKPAHPLCLC